MARPQHEPTGMTRIQVSIAAAAGMPHDQIALAIDVSRGTLEKHYKHELTAGACKRRMEVLQATHMSAMHGNVSAQRLLLDLQAKAPAQAPEEKPAAADRAPKLGKKAQAKQDASQAEQGTGWAGLLPDGVLQFPRRA